MAQVFNSSYSKRLRQEDHKVKTNLGYLAKTPKELFQTKKDKEGCGYELVVEHLISKRNALASIPIQTKQNRTHPPPGLSYFLPSELDLLRQRFPLPCYSVILPPGRPWEQLLNKKGFVLL